MQSSSQACVIVRLKSNKLNSKLKDSRLYRKYTSAANKTASGEMVMDMLDLVCLGARIAETE